MMELAGLEPATSWVRSRIPAFLGHRACPPNSLIYRDFMELSSFHESDMTRSALYGGVAYGLQDWLSVNATLRRKPMMSPVGDAH
jgi:hypothetical protein